MAKPWEISIDTGGTFTDCLGISPAGKKIRLKILSHSALRAKILEHPGSETLVIDHSWAFESHVLEGYPVTPEGTQEENYTIQSFDPRSSKLILDRPFSTDLKSEIIEIISPEEVPVFACRLMTGTGLSEKLPEINLRVGSTRGTNTLLEGKGAKTALVITEGHRDLLAIGYQQRPDLFALEVKKAKMLYDTVITVKERLSASGAVITPLEDKERSRVVQAVLESRPESVAISFMHSTKNNTHELQIKEALEKAGLKFISASSEMSGDAGWIARASTTVVNAYLDPIMAGFKSKITKHIPGVQMMTSGGQLMPARGFLPKDSLLSGPAGGVAGAVAVAAKAGFDKIITLDMGGTSTDVSRYDGAYDYQYETKAGESFVKGQALAIETIAAGGGSICTIDDLGRFQVGPESAGSVPGPACYGFGGPLTLTDINLLLSRLDPEKIEIPIDIDKARAALKEVKDKLEGITREDYKFEDILKGFLTIANEKMAEAIRKISLARGEDPAGYTLVAFGGAGGLHACAVAVLLDIKTILVPGDAGILSALGIAASECAVTIEKERLLPLDALLPDLEGLIKEQEKEGRERLLELGCDSKRIYRKHSILLLRLKGQSTTLSIEVGKGDRIREDFIREYKKIYGHWLEGKEIEAVSLKSEIAERKLDTPASREGKSSDPIHGPKLMTRATSTLFIEAGWSGGQTSNGDLILEKVGEQSSGKATHPEAALLELFTNRFKAVADQMGALLQRASFSVNVKERLDFSCALMSPEGYLIANAPHIPVHLGSLGICVRSVIEKIDLKPGDVVITNHPAFGGSHLPDITLIKAVFDQEKRLIGYVANRAHHAEIGGKIPGSMPPDAKTLEEEGVIIEPMLLQTGDEVRWDAIKQVLLNGPWPTRALDENLADLQGALASVNAGEKALMSLGEKFGTSQVLDYMEKLLDYSRKRLMNKISKESTNYWEATEALDDGTEIKVKIIYESGILKFDFSGSGARHPGNLNATPAIVNSVVLYILRLWLGEAVPLNEGLMRNVEVKIPRGFLNPDFSTNPAVMGGNTEVSQRLTGTMIKALGWSAGSQGTMNNLVFGNQSFSCYETIGGGTGAGPGFNGGDGVHHHMTNTRITDPEIMEWRYPVRLEQFELRTNSGGKGQYPGGEGIIRKIRMLEPVQVAVLTQHRTHGPYGMEGGAPGVPGRQWVITKEGKEVNLEHKDTLGLEAGDTLIMETPGGGGFGD